MDLKEFYYNKKVIVTGHTGFKGAWLTEWLLNMGAHVYGYSLPPQFSPNLFQELGLESRMTSSQFGDITDAERLNKFFNSIKPDVVFHLAAQAFVRESYANPKETYSTNLSGTINVMEALRKLANPCAAVFITTDKVYENNEKGIPYNESDPLGGYDPYSSSKACCEIAISSWKRSFFHQHSTKLCSVRAGNVIGGGDWSKDRLVPDIFRALDENEPIQLRNPGSTRPWQHVLEPLGGYLLTAKKLAEGQSIDALNFGPFSESTRSVLDLVKKTLTHFSGSYVENVDPEAVHEANLLSLSIEKAQELIGWSPIWSFDETILHTVNWHKEWFQHRKALAITQSQIALFEKELSEY
jgi:CDP-glucose 4,6-dehydratase